MRARRMLGDERRDQIAQAVMEIAAEKGAGAVSVAAVAGRIGVAPSALYRHYASKDAMLSATLVRMSERMLANIERARGAAAGPLEALERLLFLQVELVRGSRGLPFFVFSEGLGGGPAQRDAFHALVRRFRGRLAALFREGQERGDVRADVPAENLAVSFIGLYVPPAVLWNLSRGRFDIGAQAHHAWCVFRDGLRPSRTGHRSPARRRRATRTRE